MSSGEMRHPEGEQLLRFADGELGGRKARAVRAHLQACWQCRTELEELQKTVGDCVRYRNHVLRPHLPPPPAPWFDIEGRFAAIDAADSRRPLLPRIAGALRPAIRWAPVAVAAGVICAVLYQWHEAPSVEAAELLRKAAAASEARPAAPRRIEIRTKRRKATRLIAAAQPARTEADGLGDVRALFEAANYSWEDPLSPRSYRAWRDSLPEKRDHVSRSDEHYRIRTSAASGELAHATLTLSRADLHAVEGRFEFRNDEWVEISEMNVAPAAAPEMVAAAGVDPGTRVEPGTAPGSAGAPPAPAAATLSDELRVVAALHHVGADLGDPIEVTRDGGRIVVGGMGVAPERQQQIHGALASLPHVIVQFAEPTASAPAAARDAETEVPAGGEPSDFHARIEEQLGGRPQFERLSSELLDLSERMMARVYALRRLAQRFPPEASPELSAADRRLLMALGREHAAALAREAGGVERVLAPALAGMGGSPAPVRPVAANSWQPASEELFRAARRVESLLAVVLGAAPGSTPEGELPSQLLTAMAQLRATMEACERLTAEEPGPTRK